MPPINQQVSVSEKMVAEKVPVGWPWKLFLFSLLVLLTTFVVYFGLVFGYKPFLNARVEGINKSIEELSKTIPVDQQQNLVRFYSQLANLQRLLKTHVFLSKVFPFLQTNTNKSVLYNTLEVKVGEKRLSLEGMAGGYEIFSQQLEAFKVAPQTESLLVNESSAVDGKVKFKLTPILKPNLFEP